jgi:hypothetical protein
MSVGCSQVKERYFYRPPLFLGVLAILYRSFPLT